MTQLDSRGAWRRAVADFVLALALFWVVVLAAGGHQDQAFAVPLPAFSNESPLGTGTSLVAVSGNWDTNQYVSPESPAYRRQALILLSIAFAGLAAFNLAFWRHLRRAYASPRRGAVEEG